ncbi:hypothetical protein Ethha_0864 [Ethanoligenens harbinense YUAN-3]|uniref:KOW domain-containing protein n=1 Tax=Ethanoligenens harbinense (strain DSM 18485 / JCM 12961 / CGMCC 1.5033 / YUAN-3) TaxID=663278 RepID=E6U3D9_ETHHY|nr:hypothetical protein Ethha_0864 [Ethanoligenens harbinense YUAN-3]AVQ95552.1 hypothetical protein CXQ68_04470 [Ethanoligenens harbinense YUAN-3]AYF38216.1 hypothetical protein CXP51_04325 [Ethanoligenens harbinense]AYF40961.1 hypothetical protein CN246_04460 [Ethanoligenens harbinense]QCN91794.1 hypothetical protein DRA42_04470 [Ethanoligenens harbinense]
MNIKIGDRVRTNEYYNTSPFLGRSVKTGIVVGVYEDAFERVISVREKDRVIKIDAKYIEKF